MFLRPQSISHGHETQATWTVDIMASAPSLQQKALTFPLSGACVSKVNSSVFEKRGVHVILPVVFHLAEEMCVERWRNRQVRNRID